MAVNSPNKDNLRTSHSPLNHERGLENSNASDLQKMRERIMTRNSIESPFLRLPREIRDMVYSAAWGNTLFLETRISRCPCPVMTFVGGTAFREYPENTCFNCQAMKRMFTRLSAEIEPWFCPIGESTRSEVHYNNKLIYGRALFLASQSSLPSGMLLVCKQMHQEGKEARRYQKIISYPTNLVRKAVWDPPEGILHNVRSFEYTICDHICSLLFRHEFFERLKKHLGLQSIMRAMPLLETIYLTIKDDWLWIKDVLSSPSVHTWPSPSRFSHRLAYLMAKIRLNIVLHSRPPKDEANDEYVDYQVRNATSMIQTFIDRANPEVLSLNFEQEVEEYSLLNSTLERNR